MLINFFLVLLWGGPLGEEPGWRGYALPRLQAICGPLVATLILGVLWAVWHVPRWWMAGEFLPWRIVGTFIVALVAFSVVFTFLYNRARGSVLPCLLLHGSANTFYVILPVEWAWGAWTIVICAIAAVILVVDRNLGAGAPVVPPVQRRDEQATSSSATDGARMDSCQTAGFSGQKRTKMQRIAQVLQFPVVIQRGGSLLREP